MITTDNYSQSNSLFMENSSTVQKSIRSEPENVQTFDISSIQNDFIYQMTNYYLEEIIKDRRRGDDQPPLSAESRWDRRRGDDQPPLSAESRWNRRRGDDQPPLSAESRWDSSGDLVASINNFVDTIMSFYLLAKRNHVIDIENSRKILAIKLGKDPDVDLYSKLRTEFAELEKYLINDNEKLVCAKPCLVKCDIPEIDKLLENHTEFMTEVSKKNSGIKSKNNSGQKREVLDPLEMINRINLLEQKLKEDLHQIESNLRSHLESYRDIRGGEDNPPKNVDNFVFASPSASESEPFNLESLVDPPYVMASVPKINKNNRALPENRPTAVSSNPTKELPASKVPSGSSRETKESQSGSSQSSLSNQEKLDEAFQKLYSRMNTPLINLIIAFGFFKAFMSFFGF